MISISGIDNLNDFIIENSHKTIMLYFGADWCQPCAKLKDRLNQHETKKEMPNLIVGYINVDDEKNTEISDTYNIQMLPTSVFIKIIDDNDETHVSVIDRVDGHDWTKTLMIYNQINIEN